MVDARAIAKTMKTWIICMILFAVFTGFSQTYNSVVSSTYFSNVTSPTGCSNYVCSLIGDNNFNNAAAEVPVGAIFRGTWADNNTYFSNPNFPELLIMNCHTLSETWGVKLLLSDGSYTSENIYTMNNTFGNIVWNLSLFCGATSSSTSSTYNYQRAYKYVDFEDFAIPANLGVRGAEIRMISDGAGTPDPVGIKVLQNAIPLPATFGAFDYNCNGSTVEASWTMYSENQVDKYVVESTLDGVEFNTLAEVEALGNSQEEITYRAAFASDYNWNAVRLSQIDLDGQRTILGFFSVNCTPESADVFPNPATTYFSLVAPDDYGKRLVRLLTAQGEMLLEREVDFDLDPSWQFSTTDLASGVYFVELSNERDRQTIRLVKE